MSLSLITLQQLKGAEIDAVYTKHLQLKKWIEKMADKILKGKIIVKDTEITVLSMNIEQIEHEKLQ